MERFTKNIYRSLFLQMKEDYSLAMKVLDKLHTLEDIEENLGVGLDIKDQVEQADSILYNDMLCSICEHQREGVLIDGSYNAKGWTPFQDAQFLPYKTYGITWELTKKKKCTKK